MNKNKYSHLNTNITKLQELYDMQLHTAKEVDELLSKHLPHGYSPTVVERAKNIGRDTYKDWVRRVKSLMNKDLQILNLIIELAKENKAIAEAEKAKFDELFTKN